MLRMFRNAVMVSLLALLLVSVARVARTDSAPASAAVAPANADLIKQGEYLAHAADCVACHSAPGGAAYAGGRGMGSPLGTMYTTNITPDADTGIGRYSLQDFERAVRRGVAKDGHYLYPSMPYPSYAKISSADVAALYAFFMNSVKPVRQVNRPTEIPWPLNMRWPLAIWDWLFVDEQPYQSASAHDAQWNRGAYLVEGLGHCGACHTPRGWLYQEKALTEARSVYLSGTSLDNWSAADLSGDTQYGLGRWSESDLLQFFKSGHNGFGAAFGSMIDVINYSTQFLTDADNAAMAHYLKSLAPAHGGAAQGWSYDATAATALNAGQFTAPGALIYSQSCADCHGRDGKGQEPFMPALAGNPAVLDPDPVSLINVTLNGSSPVVVGGDPDAYRMISFRTPLDDHQVADVVGFIRSAWGNNAAAVDAKDVAGLRSKTDATRVDELNLLRMR